MRLSTRIFLGTFLLVVVAVAAATALTWVQSSRVARQELRTRLEHGNVVRGIAEEQRLDRMQLLADVFVADANLMAYLAEAADQGARGSILDILQERQEDLGFDFALVADPDGYLIARTDRPEDSDTDLSGKALFAVALEEFRAAGAWLENGALYHAAVVPMVQGRDLLGFFATAFRVTDEVAKDGEELLDAHISYLFVGEEEQLELSGSSFGRAEAESVVTAFSARRADLDLVLSQGQVVSPVETTYQGQRWVHHLAPVLDAAGRPVAVAVASESLDRFLAPFRRIATALAVSGALAVLFVSMLSYGLTRRSMRPIQGLVEATTAARRGDYKVPLPEGRDDEVGELAEAFDELLSELREKRDMEAYVAELQRNLPEPKAEERTLRLAVEKKDAVLVILDYRHSGSARAVSGFGELVASAVRAAESFGGRAETVAGHRVWLLFSGLRPAQQALGAVAQSFESGLEAGLERDSLPSVVITWGSLSQWPLVSVAANALVGPPVQMAETLLREALPGEVLLSREVAEKLTEVARAQGVALREGRGTTTPLPFFQLDLETVRRLGTGLESETLAARGSALAIRTGSVIDERYEILSQLGSGGMGVVYKARDRELDDVVALKLLRSQDQGTEAEGVQLLDQMKAELKLARAITHPFVLRVYDFGEYRGLPFLSMEYVAGITLRRLIDRFDRIPYSAALRLAGQICSGLQAVHQAGILHCDLKPENVILEPAGNARLMDFGISRRDRESRPSEEGLVYGTPRYLAPEQVKSGGATVASDIYALGVVLFELFTGGYPYPSSKTLAETLRYVLEEPPALPRESWAEIPAGVEQLILRCLEKHPGDRYASMTELIANLEAVMQRSPST